MHARKRSGIKKKTIGDVHQDLNTFSIGAGWYETPLNPSMPNAHKFIMMETHAGVLADLVSQDNTDDLYAACIRSATLALAWAQSIKNPPKKGTKQWAASK